MQLREEKISLERAHEEESEAQVNRLARELAALRMRQAQAGVNGAGDGDASTSSAQTAVSPAVLDPSTEVVLSALKKENESLRTRLAAAERDYIRVTRLNEIYREELIEHRRKVSPRYHRCSEASYWGAGC